MYILIILIVLIVFIWYRSSRNKYKITDQDIYDYIDISSFITQTKDNDGEMALSNKDSLIKDGWECVRSNHNIFFGTHTLYRRKKLKEILEKKMEQYQKNNKEFEFEFK